MSTKRIEGQPNTENKKRALRVLSLLLVFAVVTVAGFAVKHYQIIDLRLTNMYGERLDEKFVQGHWLLGAEEEVLVWMDLPNDVEYLRGRLEVTYPYEIEAGSTGTINIKLTSRDNYTIYTGVLEFVASDDLVLESGVEHKFHDNSGDVTFWNGSHYEMACLEGILDPGKKTYTHFSIYTSSQNDPIIFSGGYSSAGYEMYYDIRPIGNFNKEEYRSVHGGTAVDGDLTGKRLPLEDLRDF